MADGKRGDYRDMLPDVESSLDKLLAIPEAERTDLQIAGILLEQGGINSDIHRGKSNANDLIQIIMADYKGDLTAKLKEMTSAEAVHMLTTNKNIKTTDWRPKKVGREQGAVCGGCPPPLSVEISEGGRQVEIQI